MSLLSNALHESGTPVKAEYRKVWDWVRSQINFAKFRSRASFAKENLNVEVKVVLMEYPSSWSDKTITTCYYIPNGGPETSILYDYNVMDYLDDMISNRDPSVLIYTRRKIVKGIPHKFLRQLVVMFNYKNSQNLESKFEHCSETLDDSDYEDMPPLVSCRM